MRTANSGLESIGTVLLAVLCTLFGARIWHWYERQIDQQKSGQRLQVVLTTVMLVSCLLGNAWWVSACVTKSLSTDELVAEDLSVPPVPKLVAVDEIVGRTDQGRLLTLYRFDDTTDATSRLQSARDLTDSLRGVAIRRDTTDVHSNCHGTVFTGGHYALNETEVKIILKDNGYEEVEEPTPNDVVTYTKSDNHLVHTAVVKAVLDDGTVLVEGKWGSQGTYLHEINEQPYSHDWHFYRSPRHGHEIEILNADEITSAKAQSESCSEP